MPCPDILDRVAGGGMVFSAKIGPQPAPVLLIMQRTDPHFIKKCMQVTLDVVDQEVARQGVKERLVRGKYKDFEILNFGKDVHGAVAGSALLVSNKDFVIHRALDLSKENGKKSLAQSALVADARR